MATTNSCKPVVVNGTTHYPFSSSSSSSVVKVGPKPTPALVTIPSYPQSEGYCKPDKYRFCTRLHVSLHELRNAMPYFDSKYATPEHWRSFVEQVVAVYPQANELILDFVFKNAPPSALSGKVNILTHVREYLRSRGDPSSLMNMKNFYGNLASLTYFVKESQKSNYQKFLNKLKDVPISNNPEFNMLGQLREEFLSIKVSSLSELVDRIIVLFRGKVQVHNQHLWTPVKIYTYTDARRILGTYLLEGENFDILEILDICPYFSVIVKSKPHLEMFEKQLFAGSIILPGVRRDISTSDLWKCYQEWCTKMDINSTLSEIAFCWQSTIPVIDNGLKFSVSKLAYLSWTNI